MLSLSTADALFSLLSPPRIPGSHESAVWCSQAVLPLCAEFPYLPQVDGSPRAHETQSCIRLSGHCTPQRGEPVLWPGSQFPRAGGGPPQCLNCNHLGTSVFRGPTMQTFLSLTSHSRGLTSYRSQSLAKSYAHPGCHSRHGTKPRVLLDLASSARPPACY